MLTRRQGRELRALARRREREATGRFLAEGMRCVEELLAAPMDVFWVAASSSLEDSDRGRALRVAAERRGVPWRELSGEELAELADTRTPQGVLAVAAIPRSGLGDISLTRSPATLLVLDAVQDPGNFGTLARTAEALGAAGLITLPGTVDPWNPKSVRAAMGASFRLPVVAATWETLDPWLREHAVRVLAAAAGEPPLPEQLPGRAALVVGNEGAGVSAATRDRADQLVGIPLRGRAESLNVAAAAAILLYQLQR